MKSNFLDYVGIVIGLIIAGFSFFFFESLVRNFILAIALVIATIPFIIKLIASQKKQKQKEDMFLVFARDLVENVKSGSSVSRSVTNLRKRNYGELSPHVIKLANQLSIGMSLNESLLVFASQTKSKVISRAVGLISEAERAGGDIETILDSVARSVNQIEVLKKERKSAISNLVTQGYMIFIIFIVIMLILEIKILPLVTDLSGAEGLSISQSSLNPDEFAMPLFIMILVQSFFAGLVIGKISEGSLMKGVKHSFILIVVTLVLTTGVKAIFL